MIIQGFRSSKFTKTLTTKPLKGVGKAVVWLHGLALLLVFFAVDQIPWLLLCLLVIFVSWRRALNAYKILGELTGFVLRDTELDVLAGGKRLAVKVCGNPVVLGRCVAFSIRPDSPLPKETVTDGGMLDNRSLNWMFGIFNRTLGAFKTILFRSRRPQSMRFTSSPLTTVLQYIFVPSSFPLLVLSNAMSTEDHRALRFYLLHLA